METSKCCKLGMGLATLLNLFGTRENCTFEKKRVPSHTGVSCHWECQAGPQDLTHGGVHLPLLNQTTSKQRWGSSNSCWGNRSWSYIFNLPPWWCGGVDDPALEADALTGSAGSWAMSLDQIKRKQVRWNKTHSFLSRMLIFIVQMFSGWVEIIS